MLKIKENIDLKELEKFGFKKVEKRVDFDDWYRAYEKVFENTLNIIKISIHCKGSLANERQITTNGKHLYAICYIGGQFGADEITDTLFDLIQAGLVEKVGE